MIDIAGKIAKVFNARTQTFRKAIASAANATNVLVGTVTTQPCKIRSVIVHANSASQADLTSAGVFGGADIATHTITFLSAVHAAKANIDAANKQVAWTGKAELAATKVIAIDLEGTGATPVDLTVTIEYEASVDGGYVI